jgi:broad specificity phosphatase PhoE
MRNKAKEGGGVFFSDEDARRVVKGIPDHKIDITPEGVIQSEKTGEGILSDYGGFDYAYHSGYLRNERTLERMLSKYPEDERNKIKIRLNPFIRERHAGYAYDMTEKEAERYFPFLQEYWKTFGGFFSQPPGGESLAAVVQRVYLFLNMLFQEKAGKRILVVTHGGTLRCFRFLLEHWNYDQALAWPRGQEPKNCGVTAYSFDEEEKRLLLREYNKTYY